MSGFVRVHIWVCKFFLKFPLGLGMFYFWSGFLQVVLQASLLINFLMTCLSGKHASVCGYNLYGTCRGDLFSSLLLGETSGSGGCVR